MVEMTRKKVHEPCPWMAKSVACHAAPEVRVLHLMQQQTQHSMA